MIRLILAAVLAGLLGTSLTARSQAQPACSTETRSPTTAWQGTPGAHPLVGTVLKGLEPLTSAADACGPVEQLRQALSAHLRQGGIVLLGEVHDNGAQHALRGYLLSAIADDLAGGKPPRTPALVFEHIRTDQAAALDKKHAPSTEGARKLLRDLEWEKSSWPDAALFLPIFEAAVTKGLPILPGHPTRAQVREVARRGLEAMPAGEVKRLGLDAPLPEALGNALLDELEASHCGLMPRSAFGNMALAQRYRDAHMAAALADAANTHGSAILLAGNGHVRTDRGVPWDLARMVPDRRVLAVVLMEIEERVADAASYVPRDPDGRPAADFSVLTPRVDRPDPCDAMRARFKKPR